MPRRERAGKGDDVLKALRAAAKGLLYPREPDRPVEAFAWKGAAPVTAQR